MPSRPTLKFLAAKKPQIAADLKKLFRELKEQFLERAELFNEAHPTGVSAYERRKMLAAAQAAAIATALPPMEQNAPMAYDRALVLPLVRIQVVGRWYALWSACPQNGERIEEITIERWDRRVDAVAEQLARWICIEHLPSQQDAVFDMAVILRRDLEALLHPSADPASPPPFPEAQGEASGAVDACRIHPLLRIAPIRERIIAERERRRKAASKGQDKSWDGYKDGMKLHKILRAALVLHLHPLLGGSIAHRLQFIRACETKIEKAAAGFIARGEKLLRAPWVPVVRSGHGICEMAAATFLRSAFEWASSSRETPPYCEVSGSTQPARRARDCAAILRYLGDVRRRYEACDGPEFVSLNDIVRAVKNATGGKHYDRIRLLMDGLVDLGLVVRAGRGSKASWRFFLAPQIADLRTWKVVYSMQTTFREKGEVDVSNAVEK